jgi:hypothetical protein
LALRIQAGESFRQRSLSFWTLGGTTRIDITDATPDRMRAAVELFLEGVDAIELGRVCIAIRRDGQVEVSVQSEWLPENVTEQTARADLSHAQQVFDYVADFSPEFRRRVASLPRRYCVIEDYGMGSVALCYLEGDRLVWSPGFTVRT